MSPRPRAALRRDPPPAPAARHREGPPAGARGAATILLLWLLFLAGMFCRITILTDSHMEGDEVAYRVLTEQLRLGHGYTLAGTPLIGRGYPASQYGRALFFHPPGGIVLFLLLGRLFGAWGFPIAQLLSYATFFWGMLAIFAQLQPRAPAPATLVVGALAAFTPIVTHVTVHYWLDGPLLALVVLATLGFLFAWRAPSAALAALAGLALGAASWVKTTGFLALPGIVLVAWAWRPPAGRLRPALVAVAVFAVVAALVQLPWELWQWRVVGSPFPVWAGRPAPELVRDNPYVHYLTIERSPWIYVTLLPRVVWTLVPSILGLFALPRVADERRLGLALIGWIALVLAVHVALGAIGYSKLLRYVILVTPASVALCGVVTAGALRAWRGGGAQARRGGAILALLAIGIVLELVQGVVTGAQADLITPLFEAVK